MYSRHPVSKFCYATAHGRDRGTSHGIKVCDPAGEPLFLRPYGYVWPGHFLVNSRRCGSNKPHHLGIRRCCLVFRNRDMHMEIQDREIDIGEGKHMREIRPKQVL